MKYKRTYAGTWLAQHDLGSGLRDIKADALHLEAATMSPNIKCDEFLLWYLLRKLVRMYDLSDTCKAPS